MGRRDVRRSAAGQVGERCQGGVVADVAAALEHRQRGRAVARVLDGDRSPWQCAEHVPQPGGGAGGHVRRRPGRPPVRGWSRGARRAAVRSSGRPRGSSYPRGGVAEETSRQARRHAAACRVSIHGVPASSWISGRGGCGARRSAAWVPTRVVPGPGPPLTQRARPLPRLEPALRTQLVPRLLGHRPGHAQVGCEAAGAGQPVAGGQRAGEHESAHLIGELHAQRAGVRAVEGDGEHRSGLSVR